VLSPPQPDAAIAAHNTFADRTASDLNLPTIRK
jgi:hypothetical protein